VSAQASHVPFDFFGGFSSGHLAHLSRVRTARCPLSRRLWEGALHLAIATGLIVGTVTVGQNHFHFLRDRVAIEDAQRRTSPEPGCELICDGDEPIGLTFSQRFGKPPPKAPQTVVIAQEAADTGKTFLSTTGQDPADAAQPEKKDDSFENEFSLESEQAARRRPHRGLTE
jgi:hypothetical protein